MFASLLYCIFPQQNTRNVKKKEKECGHRAIFVVIFAEAENDTVIHKGC